MATAHSLRQKVRNIEYLHNLPYTDTSKMSVSELLELLEKIFKETT